MDKQQRNKLFDPAAVLLDWYDQARRDLPWRASAGENSDPYHVWLSEVMLQQTTVATVTPRFAKFLERWSTIHALANSPLDDVLHEWQGLGYYARARNLHACAQAIVSEHNGYFPVHEDELRALPGIGDYTAAAIAAIAFGQVAAPVDGNIIRVISRLEGLTQIMPAGKQAVWERVSALVPSDRPGDFAQSMMDLGAMVCTPRKPNCLECPWQPRCQAYIKSLAGGAPEDYPRKMPRKQKPTRYGVVFWLKDNSGRVFMRRRDEKGLLGGMMEFPSSPWCEKSGRDENCVVEEAIIYAPVDGVSWQIIPGTVRHTFTHFHLELQIVMGTYAGESNAIWALPNYFGDHALPTVMKKVAKLMADSSKISG